jgi:hypothetical protein
MSNGYGWNEQNPYESGDQLSAPGVKPPKHGMGSSAPRPAYGTYEGDYRAAQAGTYGGAGAGPGGDGVGQGPYGTGPQQDGQPGAPRGGPGPHVIRNDYGQAPPDTDAGRGGAHSLSVLAVLLYVGLFVAGPVIIGLIVFAAAM